MGLPTTASATTETTAAALTRGRLLAGNAGWNLITQCVPMAVALLTIPALIKGIGTDRFGVLTLAWIFLGYFSLFDLGTGRALTKLVAERLGLGDARSVPALVGTALFLMLGLGFVGALCVGFISPWLVRDVLRVDEGVRAEAIWSFLIMAGLLPFVISLSGLRGVMEAHQKFRSINLVRMATALLSLVGPLLVLPFSRSLVAVVGVMAAAKFLAWLIHVGLCVQVVPTLRRGWPVRWDVIKSLAGFGGWMTVANVVNPLMVQMDRFLVGALISTAAVAYYTTPYELVTKCWFLSNCVLGVMFPAFATSYARDPARTALIFGRGVKYIFLILFPLVLVLVGFAGEVLVVWLGADFARQSTHVLQWLALGVFLNGLAQVPSAMLQGVGRPDLTAILHVIELPLYLALACVLIRAHGIEGAAIAWTARTAVDLVLFFATARRVLPAAAEVVRRLVWALALALPLIVIAALPTGVAIRIAFILLVAMVYVTASWTVILSPAERAPIREAWDAAWRRVNPKPARVLVEALAETEHPVPSVG
jgi:O-antigen/teichoic acid export membrane protein